MGWGKGKHRTCRSQALAFLTSYPLTPQLLDGGLRELWEESGLQLPQGKFSWVPLGLWEVRQGPGRGSFLSNQEHVITTNPPKPTEQPYLP